MLVYIYREISSLQYSSKIGFVFGPTCQNEVFFFFLFPSRQSAAGDLNQRHSNLKGDGGMGDARPGLVPILILPNLLCVPPCWCL